MTNTRPTTPHDVDVLTDEFIRQLTHSLEHFAFTPADVSEICGDISNKLLDLSDTLTRGGDPAHTAQS